MSGLEQAKQALLLPDLMNRLGLGEHAKKSARCPFHEDSEPSFSVYRDQDGELRWKCFTGCGGGDSVDLLAKIEGISNPEACRRLIELSGAHPAGTRARPPVQRKASAPSIPERLGVMPDSVADAWKEGVDYLLAHPISAVGLASFRGWPVPFAQYLIDCAEISFPLYYNGRGIAFQVSAPEGERGAMTTRPVGYHIRLKGKPGEKATWRFLPNEQTHKQSIPALPYLIGEFEQARLLIITEGQWDALTFAFAAGWLGDNCLWPANVGVIGVRGASGVNPFLRWYDRFWPERARCLLMVDADPPGSAWYEGKDSFADRLSERCQKVEVVDCASHKDFNDLYRAEKPGPEIIAELLASRGMAVEYGGAV